MRITNVLFVGLALLAVNVVYAGWTYEATYGGSGNDQAYAVIETQNHKYLLVGYSESSGNGTRDGYLVEVAPHGELIWQKSVDFGGDEYFRDVYQLPNGDLLLVGKFVPESSDNTDALLVRMDSTGNVIWHKTLGGDKNETASHLAVCPDGNFVFVGSTKSFGHGNYDVWLVKFTPSGDTLWTRTFGGTTEDNGNDVTVDAAGNIYINGRTFNPTSPDFYMLALAPNASTRWIKSFGTGGWEEGYGITLLGDNIVFAGYLYVGGGHGHDMCALCMTASGDTAWTGHYGTSLDDFAYSVCATPDNGLLLVGEQRAYSTAQKDAIVAKLDAMGHQIWFKKFGYSQNEIFRAVTVTSDGYYLLAGYTNSLGNGGDDVFLVKTDANGEVTAVQNRTNPKIPTTPFLLSNFPNPFNPSTWIRFQLSRRGRVRLVVRDINGRVIRVLQNGILEAGQHQTAWDGRNDQGQTVGSGVYICQLQFDGRVVASRKITLLK